MGLKIVIILCVFAIMVIGSIYTYRYLNDKLMSSRSSFGLIFFALLLFVTMAGIYFAGLFSIVWLYNYLSS
ncbi:hypothetical protein ABDK00_009855 [Niabella insulamsoli]|uniref:hypothetical protein n=1 Tax=Niabella insulamsoli TaxID=3144874 RepID=UPI0031FD0594